MSVNDVLRINMNAFDHMLQEIGKTYAEFVLNMGDDSFRLNVAALLSDAYEPRAVLDGGGQPYDSDYAKLVLLATALDIPMTALDQVKSGNREEFFFQTRKELRRICWQREWYTRETFALRMRPMLEGSRKSLEGFWLERSVRESLTRVAEQLGLSVDPKNEGSRYVKNRTVITLRGHKDVIRAQVKGVNNARHHPERAKILSKFADEVAQDAEFALPILVGNCGESYRDMTALQYLRMDPSSVIEMGARLDEVLMPMVCRLM